MFWSWLRLHNKHNKRLNSAVGGARLLYILPLFCIIIMGIMVITIIILFCTKNNINNNNNNSQRVSEILSKHFHHYYYYSHGWMISGYSMLALPTRCLHIIHTKYIHYVYIEYFRNDVCFFLMNHFPLVNRHWKTGKWIFFLLLMPIYNENLNIAWIIITVIQS